MQIQSFNAELAIANLMFLRLFNNITLQRTSKSGEKRDVKVACVLGQRSRILKSWQSSDRKAALKLPMVAVNRTGYARNPERLNGMHNEVKHEMTSSWRSYDLLTPVPIDVSYDVSIIARYPSDIDQIASNFIVFFNPDVYVTCEHPKYQGVKLHSQVIMSDSVSEEHPDEIDSSTDDVVTATFQFTFKTWLFAGNKQAKLVPRQMLSTQMTTVLSDVVYELTDRDKANLSAFADKPLSTYQQREVSVETSSWVDNPEISDQVYDGFVPQIKSLDFGFYAVSQLCSYSEFMADVDQRDPDWPWVDRIKWAVDATSPNDFPENVYPVRTN